MGLVRKLIDRMRGDTSASASPQQAAPDAQQPGNASLPDAPPKREKADQDLFSYQTIGESKPGSTDELVAKMVETNPVLGEFLKASSEEEQDKIIHDKLKPQDYERVLLLLDVIEYHYKVKAKRFKEALSLAKLQYRLATMLPEGWLPQDPAGHTRARHIADGLQGLGSIYVDLGKPSQALEYNLQAAEWYDRDQAERQERGILVESAFDQIFHERDVRAILFENTAKLFGELGDSKQAEEYARRAAEIDFGKPTNQSKIARLMNVGQGTASGGDFDSALGAFHQALDLALADSNSRIVVRDVVTASHFIGTVLADLRLFRQALRYHNRSLELNRKAGHTERMSYDHYSIGKVLEARSDLGDPLEHYEAAIVNASAPSAEGSPFTWEASDGARFSILDPNLAWPSTLAAARVCADRQDYQRAESFLTLTIELGEVMRSNVAQNEYRMGFQARRMEAYRNMVTLQARLSERTSSRSGEDGEHKVKAFTYAERARSRSFLDLLGTASISLPIEVPAELRAREVLLAERLRELTESRPTPMLDEHQTNWAAYESTRAELETIWQEIIRLVPAAADYVELRQGRPIEIENLRGLLIP